jgi:serine/threonine protein kinase
LVISKVKLLSTMIALNPESPARHKPDFPEIICQILLKLMAKDANDRCQSARGLKADLLTCSNEVKNAVPMEIFPLGKKDQTGTLKLPRKLYGRDQEVNLLLESYRLTLDGEKAMVTISGLPGVGKPPWLRKYTNPSPEIRDFFFLVSSINTSVTLHTLHLSRPWKVLYR